jgi:heme A synthase
MTSPTLRRITLSCVPLMFVVVLASAFLRHHGASTALQAAWSDELALARQVHRVAATLVLLGAIAMVVLLRRVGGAPRACALALLGTALLLSLVGVAAGASRAAPIVLVNLLGGFAMLALCARLAMRAPHRGLGRAAAWALGLIALQAAGGVLASTTASPQCIGLTDCSVAALWHRVSGVVLAFALVVFGLWAGWRMERREGTLLALLGVALLLVGTLAAGVGSASVPALVVVHNALAAVAVAATVRLL